MMFSAVCIAPHAVHHAGATLFDDHQYDKGITSPHLRRGHFATGPDAMLHELVTIAVLPLCVLLLTFVSQQDVLTVCHVHGVFVELSHCSLCICQGFLHFAKHYSIQLM
jgi:hypothetical protein